MTISVQTPRSGPYSGDGSTTTFAYGFLIDAESELVVVVADANGVETVQTITTDYTVTGVGSNSGGTVVFEAGSIPAATETVSIRRSTSLDQGVDLQNRGSVVPQVLEDTYDEVVKMVQDLQEQMDRAILLKLTANTTGIDVPAPDADKVLGWNAAGTNLENKTPNTGAYLTTPASVTDNALVRFDGTTGEAFQEGSGVVVADDGDFTGVGNITSASGITDVNGGWHLDMNTSFGSIDITNASTTGYAEFDVYNDLGRISGMGLGGSAVADDGYAGFYAYSDEPRFALVATNVAAEFDLYLGGAANTFRMLRMDVNGKLNIGGDDAPSRALSIEGTDAIKIPVGTTAQRPSTPVEGDIRRNTSTTQWEGYDGSTWGSLGGAGLFRGNNGTSGDSVNGSGDIFRVNSATLTANEEIESGENASCAGPLTINSGITLTVTGTLVIV